MKIFQTERLNIRILKEKDKKNFIKLLSNPRIIDPASHQKTDITEVHRKFEFNSSL